MKKRRKKSENKRLKDEAWRVFSIWIRNRDLLPNSDMCECCTCGARKHWKEMQAGHFVPGRSNSILFIEENVHAQCLTKESNLRMFNGSYKSISQVKKGDALWAFDEKTFDLCKSYVINANSFIPKELYEIKLENGDKFFATKDHKVVANKEWVTIEQMLHTKSTYDILEL